jgi:hypothetical protein
VTNDAGEVNWSPSAPLSASDFETQVSTPFVSAWQILKEVLYEEAQEANGYSSNF